MTMMIFPSLTSFYTVPISYLFFILFCVFSLYTFNPTHPFPIPLNYIFTPRYIQLVFCPRRSLNRRPGYNTFLTILTSENKSLDNKSCSYLLQMVKRVHTHNMYCGFLSTEFQSATSGFCNEEDIHSNMTCSKTLLCRDIVRAILLFSLYRV